MYAFFSSTVSTIRWPWKRLVAEAGIGRRRECVRAEARGGAAVVLRQQDWRG
jgi:hypothetical protein